MAEWLTRGILTNPWVTLEPVSERHWGPLAEIVSPDTFRYFTSIPEAADPAALEAHYNARPEASRADFAILDSRTGEYLGSSAFIDALESHRSVEVGYTWFADRHRGGFANPATKLLMVGHAIAVMGCLRVQLKTDARNSASLAAIRKLGAVEEGTLRNHRVMPDGFQRATTFFSIIPDDWPAVRARLEDRLREWQR